MRDRSTERGWEIERVREVGEGEIYGQKEREIEGQREGRR